MSRQLPPQSVRTPEAAGFAFTGPPSVGLCFDFRQGKAILATTSIGDVIRLPCPPQLLDRRVYVLFPTSAGVFQVTARVDFYLNGGKVASLNASIINDSDTVTSGEGMSIVSSAADLGQNLIPNQMKVNLDGVDYLVNPYEVRLQCDEIRLNVSSIGAAMPALLGIYSE